MIHSVMKLRGAKDNVEEDIHTHTCFMTIF